ncbi:urea ABC transporter permease subunit UrtC [Gordonia sp. 852002-50816_SCH5313054-c]|uniref:urea ABC transporter permease subunit UrtC n=1 Tax=unclassified Gordonia (in: high G+C Gram-positive bacteria) TaxID=2657482 RepID=UPI0007EBAC5A|nr:MULTISPECIES: urea ABC transporter permease subunit UrtC [unclassified Gordonia (in: high G+C Gram-positive bacteria)]OBC07911.1 urea ABC transporter permease subunit UrtC [Gordonia sp. 852002-50816_SCH5313054-a]OBC15696.1 urea ABC transporter permease subunit UrtC [Gordonia sp. 852002-50816_SCH5313054-c]
MNRINIDRFRPWIVLGLGALILFCLAPLALSDYNLGLLAKFLCFGLVATGIGLAWGRGGMLTLGQGVFFGLGAYMMAMHLKLADAALQGSEVPDFLQFGGATDVPMFWEPFRSGVFTVLAIIIVPTVLAVALGLLVFKRRVKGAYFAILSQALAAAFAVFLVGQQSLGSSNGINRFNSFFGYDLADPVNRRMLFFLISGAVLLALLVAWQLRRSRYGKLLVAVRDQEERVRFLGYDPANAKVGVFALAALLASVGGALFVPIVGIISPTDVGVVPSIAFVIGVAIGGRDTLLGPVLGAVVVALAQTYLSDNLPQAWPYLQGLLFIVVIGFVPAGLAGLGLLVKRRSAVVRPDATSDLATATTTITTEPTASEEVSR